MNTGKNLRLILAAAAVVALGVILVYFAERRPQAPDDAVVETAGEAAREQTEAATVRSESTPAETAGRPAIGADSAWSVVDPESVDELPPYKEVVPGRALVRVSEALRLGTARDRLQLEVPQLGRSFAGAVESVDTDPYGNVTYIGLLTEADGRDYRFIITAGARNTFAHIGTSRGTFELVATKDDLGWLMPTASMDQHVDYSKPDYFIREETPPNED
ncbi:MAG: hypothetical protein OXH45_01900 [Gammaproteobacteria bacterium]|nr:hypothetical protein [Gammaproteobacteria bacterium]